LLLVFPGNFNIVIIVYLHWAGVNFMKEYLIIEMIPQNNKDDDSFDWALAWVYL